MALGDFKVLSQLEDAFAFRRIVASGTTSSINAGEPSKEGTAGAVVPMVDGNGTTSQNFSGIAKSTSTETTTVAGEVYTWLPLPGIMYSGKTLLPTAISTPAALDALMFKRVVFDLTANVWTIDTAAANAATNGVIITGGEPKTGLIYFNVGTNITKFGNPTTA